ncbi:MAG: sigma-70 family RNA polymerase sigma factor [Acidobacteriota bacterium]
MSATENVTLLLERWQEGDESAFDELFPVLYAELRKLALHQFNRENDAHTLQPTAIVNEAYVKLIGQDPGPLRSRRHFYALAAKAMRQILIDHARRKQAEKRAGGLRRVTLTDALGAAVEIGGPEADDLVLDEALRQLAELKPRAAQVVELRYFGGLTSEATAEILNVTRKTVTRDWNTARLWLLARLES